MANSKSTLQRKRGLATTVAVPKRPASRGANQQSNNRNSFDQLPFDFERIHAIISGRLFWYIAQEMQNGEISYTQQNALYSLFLAKTLSVGKLAVELSLSQTATSHMIDRLLAKGLVTRAEDPDDRRRKVIALTDAGRERILDMKRYTIESYIKILKPLPRDVIDSLAKSLRQLAEHLPSPTLPDVELRWEQS